MLPSSKPRLAVIRPQNDRAAVVLAKWAEALLTSLDCEFVDLKGLAASRGGTSGALTTTAASLFFCHGTPEALLGHGGPLLDAKNANLTAGRIIVAVACSAARVLGTATVLEGAIGFLGFNQELSWCPDFAEEFGEAAVSGIREMAKGATLAEAADTTRRSFVQLSKSLSENFGKTGAENAVFGMIAADWNQKHVEVKGDKSATLTRAQTFSARAPGT